jgi:hypothetical protein
LFIWFISKKKYFIIPEKRDLICIYEGIDLFFIIIARKYGVKRLKFWNYFSKKIRDRQGNCLKIKKNSIVASDVRSAVDVYLEGNKKYFSKNLDITYFCCNFESL